MLFDLQSGKRRRVVQVVYSLLAVSFLIGFVFFGVGTGGIGSISDLFGGGGSGGSVSSQFDDKINAANQQLARNPKDTAALLNLAENQYFKGKQGVSQDPTTGQVSISGDAHTELGQAADAWTKYLKYNKGKPDAAVAAEMVQVYVLLNDASGAAQAQRSVAVKTPSPNSYGSLALFLYYAGNIAGGDAATARAESLAPKSQRTQVKQQLDKTRKQAVKAKQQQAKAQKNAPSPTPGANPLQSPLGSTGAAP
jgi:predicted Zn-dependent protease